MKWKRKYGKIPNQNHPNQKFERVGVENWREEADRTVLGHVLAQIGREKIKKTSHFLFLSRSVTVQVSTHA